MLVISMLLVHGSRSAWSSSVLLLLDDLPGVYEPFFRAPFRGCESGGGGLNAPPPSHIVDGVDGAIFQLCQLSRGEREAANKSWFALWKRASLIRVCVVSSGQNTRAKRVAAGDPRRRPDFRDEKHRCCAPTAGACRTNCRRCRRTRVDLRPAVRTHHFFHVQPAQRPTTVTINYQHPRECRVCHCVQRQLTLNKRRTAQAHLQR